VPLLVHAEDREEDTKKHNEYIFTKTMGEEDTKKQHWCGIARNMHIYEKMNKLY
jgi:hypothetical protein